MSIYMAIKGVDNVKGSGTIEKLGEQKSLIPVSSVVWGAGRPINIQIGAATNAETGQVDLSDVTVSRTADGASPYIETFFFQPGGAGRTVDFIISKADRKGDGKVPSMIITLEEARMSSYGLSAADAQASETFSLVYTNFAITHYNEEEDGDLKKGDTIKFDLKTAKLESAAKLG